MAIDVPPWRFDLLVRDALDTLPAELAAAMDNVAIQVRDEDPDEPDLLGLYDGTPLTERGDYTHVTPDVIWIYRLPICDMCASFDEVVEEVRVTVIHEIAHHFGIDDHRLDELGWA
jgi:predicted Zn-dependent protease with MMP-like domain